MTFKTIKELVLKKLERKGYVEQEALYAVDLTIESVKKLMKELENYTSYFEMWNELKSRISG